MAAASLQITWITVLSLFWILLLGGGVEGQCTGSFSGWDGEWHAESSVTSGSKLNDYDY